LIQQCHIDLQAYHDHDYYGLHNDPGGLNRQECLDDMKEYWKEMACIKRDKPKLYALILQYLSKESLDAMKKEAEWETIERQSDPEGLWE
jgi:hypothetical protein